MTSEKELELWIKHLKPAWKQEMIKMKQALINCYNEAESLGLIEKGHTKTIHTCRANFIAECINNFPEKLLIIQEIVGHSKHKGEALTIDTYAKGFNINLKQEIVNSVTYQQ